MTTNPHPLPPAGQRGMALLLVLAITAATTLLTAHLMAVAETIARDAAMNAMTARLRLDAESATDTALWMHLTDRRLFSSRTLGTSLEDRETYSDFEPWMLDGRVHPLADNCSVYLNDAIKAFSIADVDSLAQKPDQDDTQAIEDANTFIDIYKDYIDSNDLVNIYGKEQDAYAQDGFPTLPRNGDMEFRAELFWLDNWRNVITGDITIIPPKNIKITKQQNAKPNFFTCSEDEIRSTLTEKALSITDASIQTIIDARAQWQATGDSLDDLLDGELLITVKNYFSFTESGYAEITAIVTAYDGALRVVRTVTREVNASSSTFHSDRQSQTLSVWETRSW